MPARCIRKAISRAPEWPWVQRHHEMTKTTVLRALAKRLSFREHGGIENGSRRPHTRSKRESGSRVFNCQERQELPSRSERQNQHRDQAPEGVKSEGANANAAHATARAQHRGEDFLPGLQLIGYEIGDVSELSELTQSLIKQFASMDMDELLDLMEQKAQEQK